MTCDCKTFKSPAPYVHVITESILPNPFHQRVYAWRRITQNVSSFPKIEPRSRDEPRVSVEVCVEHKTQRFFKNVPREHQLKLYSEAKAFLHTMIGEHFGISVVEGMAAGLVPVVHKSGGPWNDIVLRGKYGFGYTSSEEAVKMLSEAISNYWSLREISLRRAKVFSKDKFKQEFKEIIKIIQAGNVNR